MNYDQMFQLVSLLALMSIAVERTLEIIINLFRLDVIIKNSLTKKAVFHILGTAVGAAIYALNPDQMLPFMSEHFNQWTATVVVGLLASGGSGFWHDMLKVVSGMSLKAKA